MSVNISDSFKALCCVTTIKESKRAAEILCNYFNKVSGGDFKISYETLEKNNVIFKLTEKYGDSGFFYNEEKGNLYFLAKNEQAFVYAVYDLLERVVGCRFYSRNCEYIPNIPNLALELDAYSYVPSVDYREIYYKEFEDKEFAEKHKLSPSNVHEGWGFWCHSFQNLLPNDEYFDKNPEYFALIDGKRDPKGEPCLSNPEVKRIMIGNLRKFMDEKPECKYWSVSQNDDNLYCRCEECQKITDYDESQMGPILTFVNEVAKEFPDKVISTLSYWYSRKPPKHTRPAENVHMMVCNIEANRGLPIETDSKSINSKNEYLAWSSISGNVSLWDYNIQFANLVSPFPNLRTLGPNMRFFVENNLKLLFSQCNREIGGEFHELRGYILAKLAWDSTYDTDYLIKDFCNGYYGAAAPYIIEYINIMHDAQEHHNERLDIFGGPKKAEKTYLKLELYNQYKELFDKAEHAVKDKDKLHQRVKIARLPLYYAGIVLEYGSIEERMNKIIKFAFIARSMGLEMVEEWKITVDKFVTDSVIALETNTLKE